MPEHPDPGQTHFVGDGCQPAHDPAIDQTPPEVTFDELHAEYLREIASKLRAEAEVERLTLADRQWADHVKRLSEDNERLQARVQALQECFDLTESEA